MVKGAAELIIEHWGILSITNHHSQLNNNRMNISLIDFCKQNGYNGVSKVRTNAKGYPYLTLINKQNATMVENVYLGKEYGATVKVDEVVPLAELFVNETINEAGEMRLKITNKSGVLDAAKAAEYQDIN